MQDMQNMLKNIIITPMLNKDGLLDDLISGRQIGGPLTKLMSLSSSTEELVS
jgi:hypothetical protein